MPRTPAADADPLDELRFSEKRIDLAGPRLTINTSSVATCFDYTHQLVVRLSDAASSAIKPSRREAVVFVERRLFNLTRLGVKRRTGYRSRQGIRVCQ